MKNNVLSGNIKKRDSLIIEIKKWYRTRIDEYEKLNSAGKLIGREYSEKLTEFYDTFIQEICSSYFSRIEKNISIIATGGYSRKELNPFSDIDLLIVLRDDYKKTESVNKLLYFLWDCGLKIGYAVRTVADCIKLAESDIVIKTSLIELRYLWGNPNLFKKLVQSVEENILYKNYKNYLKEKIQELYSRHSSYNDNPLSIEPDIKTSPGGLRDIHNMMWIGRLIYGDSDLKTLLEKSIFTEYERKEILNIYDYYIELRNRIHRIHKRKKDKIEIDLQDELAGLEGIESDPNLPIFSGEIWLRKLLLKMMRIANYTRTYIEWHNTEILKMYNKMGIAKKKIKEVHPGFIEQNSVIFFKDRNTIYKKNIDLIEITKLFLHMQLNGDVLSESLILWIRRNTKRIQKIDNKLRIKLWEFFISGLKNKYNLDNLITSFLRTGLLSIILPEFNKFECFYRRDAYHKYTVDVHTLKLFSNLKKIFSSENKDDSNIYKIYNKLERLDIIHLYILFHDIGKIYGKNHSQRSAEITEKLFKEIKYDNHKSKIIVKLIKDHLLMNHIAIRRDIDDDDVIEYFKKNILDEEYLNIIYIFTVLDLKSVAPGVWNEWKNALLYSLYLNTKRKMTGTKENLQILINKRIADISKETKLDKSIIQNHILGISGNYVKKYSLKQILQHIDLTQKALSVKTEYVFDYNINKKLKFTELIICGKTRKGIFAVLSGILTYLNMNILSADILTRSDGIVIDTFNITTAAFEPVKDIRKWTRFEKMLKSVNNRDIHKLVQTDNKQVNDKRITVNIRFDNRISDKYTVLEVETEDRLGVLYKIGKTLAGLNISIESARITTEKFLVLDIFNIIDDLTSDKITDKKRLEKIEKELKNAISC